MYALTDVGSPLSCDPQSTGTYSSPEPRASYSIIIFHRQPTSTEPTHHHHYHHHDHATRIAT